MGEFRISKYNPRYVINGIYSRDEWTDYSDVGAVFDGSIFTMEEYLRVENNYISCISDILLCSKVEHFNINSFEPYEMTKWSNKQRLLLKDVLEVARDCLRGRCWCKLESNNSFIHFGYDYYIYIGVAVPCETVAEICSKYGLYCNEQCSPYQ